jgi:hypothetical protein
LPAPFRMQSSADFNPLWLIPVFPVFFVCLWCGIVLLISRLSGWANLANRFRLTLPFAAQKWGWQSARMRYATNYSNCLTVGADPMGLYLDIFPLWRIGHSPLLIPWHEVSVRRRVKVLVFTYVELRLGREEQIPFRISATLASRIQAAAGPNWPVEATS